ncbi:predicted protein [Postia placenta Mad-698-R]|uniref:Uncharacterized protein n=1 Tax=Postia placenta MAD-698-R-SB12 TaxID=670580 RepID=A0A1X6NBL4_9APHY|nr:hypothetical protein POSPLADRAFT_1043471 [Postia placenta MAD-698-R-SB12]EED81575.1 predicted protein [Postia placenta Mad-698-R]OSX65910.1 hypothetical protein POSPLADRAFT_1043471 [Postia placenta MAD-698-R-SB12]
MDFLSSSSTSPVVIMSLPNGILDIPTLLRKSLTPSADGAAPKAEASWLPVFRAQYNTQEAIKELTFETDALEKDAANVNVWAFGATKKVQSMLDRALNVMSSCLGLHSKIQDVSDKARGVHMDPTTEAVDEEPVEDTDTEHHPLFVDDELDV